MKTDMSTKVSCLFLLLTPVGGLGKKDRNTMNIPQNLSHKPIVAIDYEKTDNIADPHAGDAKFLSLGRATWDDKNAFSAKVFRRIDDAGKWSRQSEELPFWRLLDLAALLIAFINDKKELVNAEDVNSKDMQDLKNYIIEHKNIYEDRIKKLKEIL